MPEDREAWKQGTLPRATQWLTLALLVIACVLLVYTTVTLARVNRLLDRISDDLARTLSTTARMSARVDSFEQKLSGAVRLDEVGSVIGEIASIRKPAQGPDGESLTLSSEARAEIRHLISSIARHDGHFEADGKAYTPRRLHMQMLAKYKMYESSLASAEDFVGRVAAKSMTGKPYLVVTKEDAKRTVGEWMKEELRKLREGRAK